MSKILFCLVLLVPCLAQADFDYASIELRASGFFHTSERFREVFGTVGPDYGIQISDPIDECLEIWMGYDYFGTSSRNQEGCGRNSHINIHSLSFGLNRIFSSCYCFDFYCGLGAIISAIDIKENSCAYGTHRVNRGAPGLVVKSGVLYPLTCSWFVDIFADYLYQPIHFERQVDIGGFKIGGGLGYTF